MRARCECRFVFTKCGLMDSLRIGEVIGGLLYGAGGLSKASIKRMKFNGEFVNAVLQSPLGKEGCILVSPCGLTCLLCGHQCIFCSYDLFASGGNSLCDRGAMVCGLCGLGTLSGGVAGGSTGGASRH